MNVIQTHALCYSFNSRQVLHDLSLEVPYGSIFGFLGPNGSGKTTTIRILLGLARVPVGKVSIFNRDISLEREAILQYIGSIIEYPALYHHLSGYDNLFLLAKLLRIKKNRIREVLALVNLWKDAHRKVATYSLGMKQRLAIAYSLLVDPRVLILDEPTNGLDPCGIREIRELIRYLNKEHGKTIFLSSHLLQEVELLCSHLAILHTGKIVFQGEMSELKARVPQALLLDTSDNAQALYLLSSNHHITLDSYGFLRVTLKDRQEIATIARSLNYHSIDLYRLQPEHNTLEDLFISLTTSHENPTFAC